MGFLLHYTSKKGSLVWPDHYTFSFMGDVIPKKAVWFGMAMQDYIQEHYISDKPDIYTIITIILI